MGRDAVVVNESRLRACGESSRFGSLSLERLGRPQGRGKEMVLCVGQRGGPIFSVPAGVPIQRTEAAPGGDRRETPSVFRCGMHKTSTPGTRYAGRRCAPCSIVDTSPTASSSRPTG